MYPDPVQIQSKTPQMRLVYRDDVTAYWDIFKPQCLNSPADQVPETLIITDTQWRYAQCPAYLDAWGKKK